MSKKLVSLALCASLGACASSMSSDFSCTAPEGLGCVSMSDADGHVTGEHTHGDYAVALNAIIKGGSIEGPEYAGAWSGPKRAPEQVWRVWFPSFVDGTGNYHADSEIYIAIPVTTWIEPGEDS